jgi:hypothetical protein
MAKDNPRNTSASIRQRLLNHSTAFKTDPNLVLIWYGLERFLYRLSVSTYSERFVLKGAMLFRLWSGANFRSTKDLDLEGFLQDEAEVVRGTREHQQHLYSPYKDYISQLVIHIRVIYY